MKSSLHKKGFTLIELLVAMTIIVIILSMVYGSYFAASKSTQACKARITVSQQAQELLHRMARQIRCSYPGPAGEYTDPMTSVSQQGKETPQNTISYFEGNQDDPGGDILHLVTTSCFSGSPGLATGLFRITYRFDKNKGALFLNQSSFTGLRENTAQKKDYCPIAENIRHLELAFFDGRQWLKNWSFRDKKELPYAVKIDITFENENSRQSRYGTAVYICCRKNQSQKTHTESSIAVKKQ